MFSSVHKAKIEIGTEISQQKVIPNIIELVNSNQPKNQKNSSLIFFIVK